MTGYDDARRQLKSTPRTWAISGAAGFIGSNLSERPLKLDQRVTGLDNFANGHERNLDEVKQLVEPVQGARFDFLEDDVCKGFGPGCLADPSATNTTNVTAVLNMLVAARNVKVGN